MNCDPDNGDQHYATKQDGQWVCVRCNTVVR